jgi:hypothetical protein
VYDLDLGGKGWEAFQIAIKLRDRLMHPKRPEDLIVTDQVLESTAIGFNWFLDSFDNCRASCVQGAINYAQRSQQSN